MKILYYNEDESYPEPEFCSKGDASHQVEVSDLEYFDFVRAQNEWRKARKQIILRGGRIKKKSLLKKHSH